jgi:MFS family permease
VVADVSVEPNRLSVMRESGVLRWPRRRQRTDDAAASPFRALRHRDFLRFFVGQLPSASGTFLQQTALGWLVFQQTGSAASLGLVLASGSLPQLLLGPWGGALADRFDLRRLLLVTQTALALLAATLWAGVATGVAAIAFIVYLNVGSGLVSVVDGPARQTFVGQLVPAPDLASAVSLNGVIMNGAKVIGPALAGVLIATVGTTPCFAVNALSYVPVLVALATISQRRTASGQAGGGVREGLRYARGRQQLWLPLVMMSLIGLLSFNFNVVLPVFTESDLGASGGTYGLLTSALSVGSVLGSLLVGRIAHPKRIYLAVTSLLFGVAMGITALTTAVAAAAVALMLTGVAAFAFVTLTSTTLQLHSSPQYRARIMALYGYFYLGTAPLGSVAVGWICETVGGRAALVVGASACLLAAGLAFRVHTPPHPDDQLDDLHVPPAADARL